MRTLELLRSFTDRELAEMDKLIASGKRKTLHTLYNELKKYRRKSGIPSSEELFLAIYNKPYTAAQSYLLRNELRLLNDVFYDFMIEETYRGHIRQHKSSYNYWLGRAFFERNLHQVFGADIDRFIESAAATVKREDMAQMIALKGLWMIYTQPKNATNLNLQKQALQQWKDELIRSFRFQLREVEAREAYLDHTLGNIIGHDTSKGDDYRTPPQLTVQLAGNDACDETEEYLILKKHTYQTRGINRIAVLKRMLEIDRNQFEQYGTASIRSLLSSLTNLATESILIGSFEQADTYLKESIDLSETHKVPLLAATMQNYICNKVNIAAYLEGILFYEAHETTIRQSRQYIATLVGKVYCHLFMGQADEALSSLPQNIQLTDQQHLTFRMVYLIAFIIRGQHDLAMNENNNIGRMIKANEGAYYTSYHTINTMYGRYLSAIISTRAIRKKALEDILHHLTNGPEQIKQLAITEFSARWLISRIESQLK